MTEYTLEFPEGYFGRREEETPGKGWLSVIVNFGWAHRYKLTFYDPIRLQQTLDDEQRETGRGYFTEPGLVVLVEVNTENVRRAVEALVREKFFESLVPEEIVDRVVVENSRSSARVWESATVH